MMDPQLLTGLGCAASMFLCAAGSAYASSYSGVYAVRSSDLKGFAPIVISGVLAIYGIIVSVILASKLGSLSANSSSNIMTQGEGYRNLSAGLSVGFACLASGVGMAFFIKELNQQEHHHHNPAWSVLPAVYGSSETESLLVGQPRGGTTSTNGAAPVVTRPPPPVNFVYLCLCLTFLEAIGLYGLIVALFLMG
jgi:ATP synthase proteolipid subunit